MLLGVVEPGGRLPVTMPKRLEDTPAFAHYPGVHDHMPYRERLFIGHRWYDAQGIEPLFPFGHGLGYTTWSMGDAVVTGSIDDGVRIEVPVTNTGARAGGTVVQCYVEPAQRDDDRPIRTLQGFARVHASAGATVTASIELSPDAFRRWDPRAGRWVTAPGDQRLLVGWSSADLSPAGVCPATAAG